MQLAQLIEVHCHTLLLVINLPQGRHAVAAVQCRFSALRNEDFALWSVAIQHKTHAILCL